MSNLFDCFIIFIFIENGGETGNPEPRTIQQIVDQYVQFSWLTTGESK